MDQGEGYAKRGANMAAHGEDGEAEIRIVTAQGSPCTVSEVLAMLDGYVLTVGVDAPVVLDCAPIASQGKVSEVGIVSYMLSKGFGVCDGRVLTVETNAPSVLDRVPIASLGISLAVDVSDMPLVASDTALLLLEVLDVSTVCDRKEIE